MYIVRMKRAKVVQAMNAPRAETTLTDPLVLDPLELIDASDPYPTSNLLLL